jgi:hypothetical protein
MDERARSQGGKFEIHSELGKGTTLRAWLPVTADLGRVKDENIAKGRPIIDRLRSPEKA